MRTHRLRVPFVAVLSICFGILGATSAWAINLQVPPTLNERDRTIPISGTVRSVIVRTDIGRIVVGSGSKHQIRVHETWNFARAEVTSSLKDGVLTVRGDCPNDATSWNKCSTDLTIVVPSSVVVDAFSNFGDITTKGLRGNEKLVTNFGDVRTIAVTASNVSAVTDYGEVLVDLVTAPMKATARSNFGDVSLKVPAGTYAIDADTQFGDVTVTGVKDDGDAPRRITGTSEYGDVAIASR